MDRCNGIDRLYLATLPTPLHPLQNLRRHLGPDCPAILIKRDDLTGIGLGGNKARKLEFLMADARHMLADTIITCGAAQSNHALQTASAAGKLDFDVVCVLDGPAPSGPAQGNLLLHEILGTKIVWCEMNSDETRREQARRRVMSETADILRKEGKAPYIVPTGGSTAVGSLGYVAAVEEIVNQIRCQDVGDISAVYFASGSGGTHAGIAVGARVSGWSTRIVGVDVDYIAPDALGIRPFHRAIVRLANETSELVSSGPVAPTEIELCSDFAGPAYGVATPEATAAAALLAASEGIFVDPVYTSKALAALLGHIREQRYKRDETVIFWHTGGAPGLFAPH